MIFRHVVVVDRGEYFSQKNSLIETTQFNPFFLIRIVQEYKKICKGKCNSVLTQISVGGYSQFEFYEGKAWKIWRDRGILHYKLRFYTFHSRCGIEIRNKFILKNPFWIQE